MDFATFQSWGSAPIPLAGTLLLVLKATTILLLAVAMAAGLRRASAGTRHLIWLVAIGAVLVLPVLGGWTPIDLRILPAVSTPALPAGVTRDAALDRSLVTQEERLRRESADPRGVIDPTSDANETLASQTAGTVSAPARGTPRLATMLFAIWATVCVLLLGRLVHGTVAVRRIVDRSKPLADEDWQARLYDVADRLGIVDAPRVLRSDEIRVPFAAGIVRATIVLPAECDDWTPGQRDAVLIHELGHVRRRDLLGHTLGRLACALYWFHPLVWTAARRLRDASERACDDLAIRLGSRPSEYADHLLRLVTSTGPRTMPGVALAMAQRKEFEGRMLAILDPALRRDAPARWKSAALSSALVVLSLLVAAAAPAPRAGAAPIASDAVSDSSVDAEADSEPESVLDSRAESESESVADSRAEPEALSLPQPQPQPAQPEQPAQTQSTSVATHVTVDVMQYDGAGQARGGSPDVLARVLRTDSSAHVRRVAAWGLKQHVAVPVAFQALREAASGDSDARVRAMATWALEASHDPAIVAVFGDILRRDDDADVREMAAWALGGFGDPAAAPILAAQLERETSDVVIGTLAWALGSIAPDRAPQRLAELLTHQSSKTRLMSAWALSNIADPTTLTAVRDAVGQPQEPATMRALLRAWIAIDGSPEGLLQLIDDADPEVRTIAVGALAGSRFDPWPWPWPRPIVSP
jgi:beta-lactamase regulating signal transducer with metallopeptidase domain